MREVLFVFLFAPFIIYFYAASRQKRPNMNFIDILNPRDAVSAEDFSTSSTAYGIQVASLSFFVALGVSAPLVGFINAIFWGIGILVFILAIPKIGDYLNANQTLHGFVSTRHNSPLLRQVTAFATILGFLSFLVAELVFGTLILSSIGFSDYQVISITFISGAFIVAYYAYGGHLSIFTTDDYQLLFGYIGILLSFIYFLVQAINNDILVGSAGMLFLVVMLIAILFSGIIPLKSTEVKSRFSTLPRGAITILFFIFMFALCWTLFESIQSDLTTTPKNALQMAQLLELGNFDIAAIVSSFILVPIIWQFGDTSNWHRLGNISLRHGNEEVSDKELKRGFFQYARHSPFTIILSLLFGVLLSVTLTNLNAGTSFNAIYMLPSQLWESNSVMLWFIAILFVSGIFGIMLSTADSLLSSAVFSYTYDIHPSTRLVIDKYPSRTDSVDVVDSESKFIHSSVIIFSLVFITASLALYYLFTKIGINIVPILFGAFAAQITLVPVVIASVFLEKRLASGAWAVASVIVGISFAIGITLAVMLGIQELDFMAPLFSVGSATIIYTMGFFATKK